MSVLEGFSDHRARAPTGRTRILDLMRAPKICFVGLGTFQVLLDFIAFSTQNVKIEDINFRFSPKNQILQSHPILTLWVLRSPPPRPTPPPGLYRTP